MLLRRALLLEFPETLLDRVHRPEEQRTVHPHDLHLRAFGQGRIAGEFALCVLGIGYPFHHLWAGGAAEVDHQREHDTHDDRLFQRDGQGGDEGDQQDRGLRPAGLDNLVDMVEIDQAPGHQEQHPRHGGIR